ncbi:MAG: CIA30 family protein [Ekhidna sp.]|nr:CIA30 family protein [Ekhidna sp.]
MTVLEDFTVDFLAGKPADWYVLNDGVMGGLSKGRAVETEEGVLFFGSVSLENNGGFTSYRSSWRRYDFTTNREVEVRYRSEGMRLALVMETSQRFWIPNFKVSLPKSEKWVTKSFNLKDFGQYRLGYPTGSFMTEDNLNEIIRIGFITDEKRAGDFKFEIASITFK